MHSIENSFVFNDTPIIIDGAERKTGVEFIGLTSNFINSQSNPWAKTGDFYDDEWRAFGVEKDNPGVDISTPMLEFSLAYKSKVFNLVDWKEPKIAELQMKTHQVN